MKANTRFLIVALFALLLLQTTSLYAQADVEYPAASGHINLTEVGDVDGDGKDDMVVVYGDAGTLSTGVSFSNGNSFTNQIVYDLTTWHGTVGGRLYIEDVNGGGEDDLIFVLQENSVIFVTVFISNGDGTFHDALTQIVSLDDSNDYYLHGGDVDGDQRFDLIFTEITTNSSQIIALVANAQPNGSFQLEKFQNYRNAFNNYQPSTYIASAST